MTKGKKSGGDKERGRKIHFELSRKGSTLTSGETSVINNMAGGGATES